jgi:hypothetical protein
MGSKILFKLVFINIVTGWAFFAVYKLCDFCGSVNSTRDVNGMSTSEIQTFDNSLTLT